MIVVAVVVAVMVVVYMAYYTSPESRLSACIITVALITASAH